MMEKLQYGMNILWGFQNEPPNYFFNARLAKKQPWILRHEEDLILIMGFVVIDLMIFISFDFVGQMDPWNNGVMV